MTENKSATITVSPGDGLVTADRLISLLSLGSEYDDLDFKVEWHPKGVHLNKFVKTLAAMSSMEKGGYVIVGVNDSGVAVGLDKEAVSDKRFDPANLGAIYKGYTGNSGVQSATHFIDEKWFAIIYVPRSPDLFSVMTKNASEKGGEGLFMAGDVFVRENTSNMKLSKISANRIVEKIRQEERDRTIRVFLESSLHLEKQNKTIGISDFVSISTKSQYEILNNRDDYSAIVQLGTNIANLVFDANDKLDNDRVRNSLSTVLSVLLLKDEKSFEVLLSHLSKRYTDELSTSDQPGHRKANIALEIIIVIEAVGSLAIRLKKFNHAKMLANVKVSVGEYNYIYASWLRHGQVMASREGVTKSVGEGMPVGSILVSKAFEEVRDVQALRPECQNELDYEIMKESLLDSIVSFDFLWCMIAFEVSGKEKDYYPGWVLFPADRIVNLVSDLTLNDSIRKLLFTDHSIDRFDHLLRSLLINPEKYVNNRDLDYDALTIMAVYNNAKIARKSRKG